MNYGKKTMIDFEKYKDEPEIKMLEDLREHSSMNEMVALYYSALVVISEDNNIDVMDAHTGVQLMVANVETPIVPQEVSKELH